MVLGVVVGQLLRGPPHANGHLAADPTNALCDKQEPVRLEGFILMTTVISRGAPPRALASTQKG